MRTPLRKWIRENTTAATALREAQRIAISEKQKRIKEKLSDKLFRKRKLEAFMCELKNAERLVSFDEQLFVRTLEQITVFSDNLVFVFKDGTEIPVEE